MTEFIHKLRGILPPLTKCVKTTSYKLNSSRTLCFKNISCLMLQLVSTTFLLACFVCQKERTSETRRNVFDLTMKALFILQIMRF